MEYKMNQVIIDVVKFYLKLDDEIDLEPLMKIILGLEKQSIMTYAQVEYPSNTADRLEEEGVQFEQIIEIYWDWKQIVLEASILKLNETDIESSASFQIGKKWEMFLEKVGDKDSRIRQIAESGAQLSEQWPEEDLFLFKFSENYIDNSDLVPVYAEDADVELLPSDNGEKRTPAWVDSLIITELNVETASTDGKFSGMTKALEHLQRSAMLYPR